MAVWLSGSLMKYCLCSLASDPDDRADTSRSSRDCPGPLILIWFIVTGNQLRRPGRGASLDNNSTNIFPLLSIRQRNSGPGLASHKIKPLHFSSITKHCSGSRNIISKIISQNCVDTSKFDAILIFTETTSEKLILSNKKL